MSGRSGELLATLLVSVALWAAAFACLNHVNPKFTITDDGVRDQLLARDCVELGRCHTVGPAASVPGFFQGAAWVDLLVAVRLAGGDEAAARTVVLVLLTLAVAILFQTLWHWLRPSIALPAAFLLLAALCLDEYPSQLINPSVAVFPDTLTCLGLLAYGLSAQPRYLMIAAFALGLALGVHTGSLSLIPSFLMIATLAHPRPVGSAWLATSLVLGTYMATSSTAVIANLHSLTSSMHLLPVVGTMVGLVVCAMWCGPRFRRLSWEARAWVVLVITLSPVAAGLLWLVFWQQHSFGFTYLHPALTPAAVLGGALLVAPFRHLRGPSSLQWIPSGAAVAGLAVIGWVLTSGHKREMWSVADARAIAAQASAQGWQHEDLIFRTQSVDCRELVVGMSLAAPAPTRARRESRQQLQIARVPSAAAASLGDLGHVVALCDGNIAMLRTIDSWMLQTGDRSCLQPVAGTEAGVCSIVSQDRGDAFDPDRFLFLSRSFPEIHNLELPLPYREVYEIPLFAESGQSRDLTVLDSSSNSACSWRITRVEGLAYDGKLPAVHIRLHAGDEIHGKLVLEKPFGTSECRNNTLSRRYPPCLLEMAPTDPLLPFLEAR